MIVSAKERRKKKEFVGKEREEKREIQAMIGFLCFVRNHAVVHSTEGCSNYAVSRSKRNANSMSAVPPSLISSPPQYSMTGMELYMRTNCCTYLCIYAVEAQKESLEERVQAIIPKVLA